MCRSFIRQAAYVLLHVSVDQWDVSAKGLSAGLPDKSTPKKK